MQTPILFRTPHSPSRTRKGFTLVELLIVIAIIAVLAAMIFPVTAAVNKMKIRSKTQTELKQIESAIENYKTALGHYPPDNPGNAVNPLYFGVNPLYYELLGTTPNPASGQATSYTVLGENDSISVATLTGAFGTGVQGFANCTRGNTEEARKAKNFLAPQLNVAQIGTYSSAKIIVCSVASPQTGVKPMVCYNSSNPAHNKNSFDLWIDVPIGNQINRICNWSDKPIIGATTYP